MTSVDLGEIRALLRTEHVYMPQGSRAGLLGALKTWLQPPTPASPAPRRAPVLPLPEPFRLAAPEDVDGDGETATLELFTATALPSRRRGCFGLADGAERAGAPEAAAEPQPELDFDPVAAVVVTPRRGEAQAADAGVGAAEVLELQELLAERMPALLTRIDLAAKLDPAVAALVDEPSVDEVIASVEAAREAAFAVCAPDAREAEPPAEPARARLRFVPPPPARTEGAVLTHLHAHLEAEHHALAFSLAGLHDEFAAEFRTAA